MQWPALDTACRQRGPGGLHGPALGSGVLVTCCSPAPTTTEHKAFARAPACADAPGCAAAQARYMVGEIGNSFVVGYGTKPPILVQDAASSCPKDPTAACGALQARPPAIFTGMARCHASTAPPHRTLPWEAPDLRTGDCQPGSCIGGPAQSGPGRAWVQEGCEGAAEGRGSAAGPVAAGQPVDGAGRPRPGPRHAPGRAPPVAPERRDRRAGASRGLCTHA